MTENLDIRNAAVSLLVGAALLAARFSGQVRRRSLKRLAAMDAEAQSQGNPLSERQVCWLEMQLSIL